MQFFQSTGQASGINTEMLGQRRREARHYHLGRHARIPGERDKHGQTDEHGLLADGLKVQGIQLLGDCANKGVR